MNQLARRLGKRILFACRSQLLYHVCKRYAQVCDNDNEDDMSLNGEIQLLQESLPQAQTIFDVGANLGIWTRAALRINPQVAVHCFEPCLGTYRALQNNRFPPQVVCNNFALGDRAGQAVMHINPNCSGGNSIYCREWAQGDLASSESVSVRTLDDYCSERGLDRIDLLKIDVEGHELAVLRGSQEMLRSHRISVIQFEYGGTYLDARILLKDVWDYITSVAPEYRFHKLYPNGPKFVPAYRQSFESFQQSNWVIRRAA